MQPEPDPWLDDDLILAMETEPGALDGLPKLKGGPLVRADALSAYIDVLEDHHARLSLLEGLWPIRWLVERARKRNACS